MKKLTALVLFVLMLFSACTQEKPNIETKLTNDRIPIENLLATLELSGITIKAECPTSREGLNTTVTITPDFIKQVSDVLAKAELVATKIVNVPGASQEISMFIGGEGDTILHIYPLQDEKALVWLQSGKINTQFYAQIAVYNELKQIFDSFVFDVLPEITGEFIEAKLLEGRDIAKGFAHIADTLIAAYQGYDKQGYIDFYDTKSGELLNSIILVDGVNRLDTGKNGEVRVFQDNILHYIDVKKRNLNEAKQYNLPVENVPMGDNFDVDEKRKLLAYIMKDDVYLSDLKGENKALIMNENSVKTSLTAVVTKSLNDNKAKISYKSPRFLNDAIVATATTKMSDYPLVAMTSCLLNDEPANLSQRAPADNTSKAQNVQIQNKSDTIIADKEFELLNFPGVFGKTGSLKGYDGNKIYIQSDGYVVFANATSGEESQVRITATEQIMPIIGGRLCEMVSEQSANGYLQNIYISQIDNMQEKKNVLATLNLNITLDGTVENIVIIKDAQNERLLFVMLPSIGDR